MTAGTAQGALFDARWLVQAPYVSDNLRDGCWREPRAKAIARRYVQVNSPGLVWCVVVDVDHDDADWARGDSGGVCGGECCGERARGVSEGVDGRDRLPISGALQEKGEPAEGAG